MRRLAVLLSILMLSHVVSASPEITVNLDLERKLTDFDLGVNGGTISPDGNSVLIYGEDGYAHLLSANNADDESTDIRLEKETMSSLNDATWHPGGKSALIVGDNGTILRLNSTNYALGEAEGSIAMAGKDINTIRFTAGSSVAYLGTDDGQIWKYYADGFTLLNDEASSRITDIDCLRNKNICVAGTLNDGVAIIDQADAVTWLPNSRYHTWVGIGCEDPTMNACTGFASGNKAASIEIDILDSSNSELGEIIILGQLEGDTIGDSQASESSSIIALAPLGMVRWNQYTQDAFLMFSNDNASDEDVLLGGDGYAVAWENSQYSGFLVTSQGRIVSFEPASEADDGEIPNILIILVALCVPGVFIGLIYWNSPWLQRKYANLFSRNKKDEQ
ncbi:MAG TPA: WD40 repeat domain-containing protein [Candidatus Poseidoniales archaeon]|nr:MAG TPA: WD40 repeat domain-containing protein [Candidatus Poseidoniales archaeon]HIH57860.1 WD40 repeat domain-containing protein [Candidatus Poseidoniaceae archaeon]